MEPLELDDLLDFATELDEMIVAAEALAEFARDIADDSRSASGDPRDGDYAEGLADVFDQKRLRVEHRIQSKQS